LSLGYVVVPSFRWSSAPELLDAHPRGITGRLFFVTMPRQSCAML